MQGGLLWEKYKRLPTNMLYNYILNGQVFLADTNKNYRDITFRFLSFD